MTGDTPPSRRFDMSALVVSAALFASNVAGYLFTVLAARALTPAGFGELGSLMAVLLVGLVPALAVQTGVALHVAAPRTAGPEPDSGGDAFAARAAGTALTAGLGVGGLVAAAVLVASPALVGLLHVHDPLAVTLLALTLLPLAVLNALRGALQGHRRFTSFAVLVGLEGLARIGGGLAGLLVTRTPLGAFAGMAAGSAAVALAAWAACGYPAPARPGGALARTLLHATWAMLGLVVLQNLDVVLARQALPAAVSGVYAVGLVINKIAYWLPQAVGVIALPRLADAAGRGRVVRLALLVVVVLDAPVVLVSLAGSRLLRLIGGAGYGSSPVPVWLFAVTGTLLAVAQLLLFSGIAGNRRLSSVPVWGAIAAEIVLVRGWLHHGVGEVAGAAATCVALLVVAGLLIENAPATGDGQAGRDNHRNRGKHRALGRRSVRPVLAVAEHPAGDGNHRGNPGGGEDQQPRHTGPQLPRQHGRDGQHDGQHAAQHSQQGDQRGGD